MTPGLKKAIAAAGGAGGFARLLKVDRTLPYKWVKVPAERIIEIERLIGVPREELRPDLYERPAGPAPKKKRAR